MAGLTSYASWTGTKRNLTALHAAGWRLLMSPDTLARIRGKTYPIWPDGTPALYALDNGAWGAFQQGVEFNDDAFRWALDRIGDRADWTVIPDCVQDKEKTLERTEKWWPEVERYRPLLAVQDDMTEADVLPWLLAGAGVFIGGTTEWKLKTAPQWVELAHRHGRICHMGRVNSVRRIRYCQYVGIDSIDGTNATRFSVNLPRLDKAVRQLSLFGGES